MTTYKYFSQRDFDRCTPPCDIGQMNVGTMLMFDRAREIAGVPFVITSAFRTVAHEKLQGRSGDSAHTWGRALDIRASNSRQRFKIIDGLIKAGFTRIGINFQKNFIHADNDPTKDTEVLFSY